MTETILDAGQKQGIKSVPTVMLTIRCEINLSILQDLQHTRSPATTKYTLFHRATDIEVSASTLTLVYLLYTKLT